MATLNIPDHIKEEIRRDIGSEPMPGCAYIRDEKTGKWREVTEADCVFSFIGKNELSRKILHRLGWRLGSRDEHAPSWPEYFRDVWWFEGAPYSEKELPDVYSPEMTVMLFKKMIAKVGFEEACELVRNSPAVIDDGTEDAFEAGVAEGFAKMEGIF